MTDTTISTHEAGLVQKVRLVFHTGELNPETGEPIDIAREFSVSMDEKSNLRKFLHLHYAGQFELQPAHFLLDPADRTSP